VRALGVVPRSPERQFSLELGTPEWDEHETANALALDRFHQTLDDRDTAVFAHGSEAVPDSTTAAPGFETLLGELHALVRNEMLRRVARSTMV